MEAQVGRLSRRPIIGRKRLDSSATGRLPKVLVYEESCSRHQESNEARRPVLVDSGNLEGLENVADLYLCPEYAEDIMFNEQCKAERWILPTDFLEDHNREITWDKRAVLVDWLIQVQVRTLVHLTDNTYTAEKIFAMERKILKIAEFDIASPSPMFFLDRFFMVHSHGDCIMSMAKFILDVTLRSIDQVQFSSSMRAASALFIARKLFDCEESWTPGLAYYSKYSEKDLLHCFELMVKVLVKDPQTKFQAAMSKYRYRNISTRDTCMVKLREWEGSLISEAK